MKLKIKVERVEFDMEQCSLRLNGKNVEENEFVKLGQYHTLDIVIGRPIAIEKECTDNGLHQVIGKCHLTYIG